jgi:uncharacterized Zn ribbon protein
VLAVSPCRTLCDWSPTGTSYDDRALLRCGGCGSEWTDRERWTPRQADGTVPPCVREALSAG